MRPFEERKEHFMKRNGKRIDDLHVKVITQNPLAIIMSSELSLYLLECSEYMVSVGNSGKMMNFGGVRVIIDPYHASGAVRFISRELDAEIEVPCVCGWFNDENHGAGIGGDLK